MTIEVEQKKKLIGSIYDDKWDENKVRFDSYADDKQRILTRSDMEAKVSENNWIVVEADGHSESWKKVYRKLSNYLCLECETEAMYDSEKDEFYCPRCEE